jgi:hypothetical protein
MADNHNVKIIGPVTMAGANGLPVNFIPMRAAVVTPNAATTLPRGVLFIGTGGDVLCRPADQTTFVLFKGLADGTFLSIYIDAVSADASTTATNMILCF